MPESKPQQHLHLVYGGELVDPTRDLFRDAADLHVVGIFPDYDSAYAAWKAEAQRTVDNAHMRYYIADLQKLREEEAVTSPSDDLSS